MANTKKWFERLREYISSNPEKQGILTEIYSRLVFQRICDGRKDLKDIPAGTRMKLYDVTDKHIEELKVEGTHPLELDMAKVSSEEQPRELISMRLDYDGITRKQMKAHLNVSGAALKRYLSHEKDISKTLVSQIEKGLTDYYAAAQQGREGLTLGAPTSARAVKTTIVKPHTQLQPTVDTLKSLQLGINSLLSQTLAKFHASPNDLTGIEKRIAAVEGAVDTLAEQMEYFREAPQGERESLAARLNVDRWKYIVMILRHIDKPAGTYEHVETVLRSIPLPGGKS